MAFIDRYDGGIWRIESKLGEGVFGKAYKITKDEHGFISTAALKVIPVPQSNADIKQLQSEGMDDASITEYIGEVLKDIMQEIIFVYEFKGTTNFASYEDCRVLEKEGELGFDILMRMELLESLENVLAEKKLNEADAAKVGIDICKALELLAINETIHRDIKPSNIMLSKRGDYKLDNFGTARQIERTMSGLSKKGTSNYMAPEVYKGQEYGATVDFYSLGIVLYRILNNGRVPFVPANAAKVSLAEREGAFASRIKGETLLPPANASEGMAAIILKACAYDREQRYQCASEMRSDLEKIIGDKIAVAPPKEAMIAGKYYSTSTKYLGIRYVKLSKSDLLQLSQFANLVSLTLYSCEIEDLSPLSELQKLTRLDLSRNQITDLSPLSGLKNLARLDLEESQITDLSSLSGLSNLTELYLSRNQITDVSPLSGLQALTLLNMERNQITDLSPLSGLKNITNLYLSRNQITDVSPLSVLQSLTKLEMRENQIRDVSPLSGLQNLDTLDLYFNHTITDVSPLSSLLSLTCLRLGYNQITDVSPLSKLHNLAHLGLWSNPITDYKSLCNLKKLTELSLNKARINDAEIQALREALPNCEISLW